MRRKRKINLHLRVIKKVKSQRNQIGPAVNLAKSLLKRKRKKKSKKEVKKESESESEESVKPEIKKNKWAKHLKDDGDFAGWKKTA